MRARLRYAIIKQIYVNCVQWGESMKTEKVRFYIERNSFGVQAMIILMAMSIAFRLIGCWGLWNDRSFAIAQIALPIGSALLLMVLVWLFGRRALWLSFIPVILGAVFFIIKSLGFESTVHTVLCILLYSAVIALYTGTVFGVIRTKWILVLLFGLPFLYHIFVEDLPALRDTVNPVSFSGGMQEMSVLCIMLGLFCLSLSMKKSVAEPMIHLPKIRKPKVSDKQEKPGDAPAASEEAGETAAADMPSAAEPAEPEPLENDMPPRN